MKCKECGAPLGRRNLSNPMKVSGLCFNCIRNPPNYYRCSFIYPESNVQKKKRGTRCKLPVVWKSKKGYCGVHRKKLE
ncbi:MAG: hypothetical protein ACTSWQ_03005 [Candidatus Thorarchaeota archaeon]